MSDPIRKVPIERTLQFDPEEMALRGRIGAAVTHSRHDAKSITENARLGFMAKFERDVDPDGLLSDAERQRRARHALKAHMSRLAYASAKARRNRAGGNDE